MAQLTDRLYTPGQTLYQTQSQDGIGINEDKPDAALHINQSDDKGTALHIDIEHRLLPGGGSNYTKPDYALQIKTFSAGVPGPPSDLVSIDYRGYTRIGYFGTGNDRLMVNYGLGVYQNASNKVRLGFNSNRPELSWATSGNAPLHFRNTNTGNIPISLAPDGKVGVNTEDFFGNHDLFVGGSVYIKDDGEEDHSLYIEGSSIAEEMYVKIKGDWGDFVFHRDFGLMALADLETYIVEKGHLPDMPTADEVKEEGVKTGETLRLLTIKVEELTLYILQQQKEMEQQQKEMEKLKEQIAKEETDENLGGG